MVQGYPLVWVLPDPGEAEIELVLPPLPGAALQGLFQSSTDAWSLFRDQTLHFINAVSPLTQLYGE